MSGAFTAATAVALAKARPARGASLVSVAVRQVMQTKTVARPVGSMSLIPVAPDKHSPGCGTGGHRANADSRTVEMNSTVAEAPRPARDQRDGRSPGSRVSAACRLPDLSLRDRHQWHQASAHRLQLRGQPWVCIGALGRSIRTTFPHRSLVRERPSRLVVVILCRSVVNGDDSRGAARADNVRSGGAHTIVVVGVMYYAECVVRCFVQLHWVGE